MNRKKLFVGFLAFPVSRVGLDWKDFMDNKEYLQHGGFAGKYSELFVDLSVQKLYRFHENIDGVQIVNLEKHDSYMFDPIESQKIFDKQAGISLKSIKILDSYIEDGRTREKDIEITLDNSWTEAIKISGNRLYVLYNNEAYSGFDAPIQIYNLDKFWYWVCEEK